MAIYLAHDPNLDNELMFRPLAGAMQEEGYEYVKEGGLERYVKKEAPQITAQFAPHHIQVCENGPIRLLAKGMAFEYWYVDLPTGTGTKEKEYVKRIKQKHPFLENIPYKKINGWEVWVETQENF